METTIKQAEEEKNKALENARKVYNDLKPLKEQVDCLRSSIGLDKVADLSDEDTKINAE